MRINLIGSGNVATILGRKFKQAGHKILNVYSPNHTHAIELGNLLQTRAISHWKDLDESADIYVLVVSDRALVQVASELRIGKKMVVHTAGSTNMDILLPISTNIGVLYPLQTLRKELDTIPYLTMLIDGNTEENITLVQDFAMTFSDKVAIAHDDVRLKLHTAAVIVNNFSNHLYSLAENYCKDEGVDFNLLVPLIIETASRLQFASPGQLQTGPAARNDYSTIEKHLQLLKSYPELEKIYALFSQSISAHKGGAK
ncbi:MAG TPA: Rossmann-like and DUF2520 domain-containing protein [Puia sp.]|nr:Rossmann-like and DUF2520 domain-containing protein [Puia sp.]